MGPLNINGQHALRSMEHTWGDGLCPFTTSGARTNFYATCCTPCAYGDVERFIEPDAECPCLTFFVASMLANSNAQGILGDVERTAGAIGEALLVAQQRARLAKKTGVQLPNNEYLIDACCMTCALGQELRYIEAIRDGFVATKRPPTQRMVI